MALISKVTSEALLAEVGPALVAFVESQPQQPPSTEEDFEELTEKEDTTEEEGTKEKEERKPAAFEIVHVGHDKWVCVFERESKLNSWMCAIEGIVSKNLDSGLRKKKGDEDSYSRSESLGHTKSKSNLLSSGFCTLRRGMRGSRGTVGTTSTSLNTNLNTMIFVPNPSAAGGAAASVSPLGSPAHGLVTKSKPLPQVPPQTVPDAVLLCCEAGKDVRFVRMGPRGGFTLADLVESVRRKFGVERPPLLTWHRRASSESASSAASTATSEEGASSATSTSEGASSATSTAASPPVVEGEEGAKTGVEVELRTDEDLERALDATVRVLTVTL
eukprot:TRINITY_DN4775_c0_g2_i2.p1 TRINITY_DN4775_c0_g2~~TRINITY_DN4775_c0_g2_i2.p1  ORF type:complete len:331 (+),score=66.47 TRINITY_DN4775_c0_g2_i2:298-1290(+)